VSTWRSWVARAFSGAEDVVYVGLGAVLALSAVILLVASTAALWNSTAAGSAFQGIVPVMDRLLLVLMIVELLYTVQVHFLAHALIPKPFLIIALIAATRRILVVTAQFSGLLEQEKTEQVRNSMIELALLTGMVVALVVSIRLLQKRKPPTRQS
jgi:hypothetical protein